MMKDDLYGCGRLVGAREVAIIEENITKLVTTNCPIFQQRSYITSDMRLHFHQIITFTERLYESQGVCEVEQ